MKLSVGACIAQLAAQPPAEKEVLVGNAEIIALAKKWRELDGSRKAT